MLSQLLPTTINILKRIVQHPANRGRRLSAVMKFFLWQGYKRATKKPFTVNTSGMKFICYPENHSTSALIYFNGLPDYREMLFISRFLRQGDNFIDIGANVGVYSLMAASVIGPGGHIEAFEPNQIPAARYIENMVKNQLDNYAMHMVAVGAEDAKIQFDLSQDDCCSHMVTTSASNESINLKSIDCVKLDSCLPNMAFSMAKMDIEGAEPFALLGASNCLEQSNPPVWQIEMAGYSKRHGISTSEIIEMLKRKGYFCAIYDPIENQLIPTDKPWEYNAQNVLAIAECKSNFVRKRLEL